MNADARKDDDSKPKAPADLDDAGALPDVRRPGISAGDVVGLIAVVSALGWAYGPNLVSLYKAWNEPEYTHGFLVLPIAAVILWRRWPGPDDDRPAPWWPGWALVLAGLAARVYCHERGQTWSESFTLLIVIIGLAFARLGWRTMRQVWPAFAFLIFLYPLPPQVNSALSQPLQSLATTLSCGFLRLTGLWVMPEGNVIMVGNQRLEVAVACNGLSMLMSLAATVAATASLVPMVAWKRILLLLSIIPIALISNVLRIAATAWCYHAFGAKVGGEYAHDLAGWLMMPTAMLLVALELAIASWLIIETEEVERTTDRLGLGLVAGPPKMGGRP